MLDFIGEKCLLSLPTMTSKVESLGFVGAMRSQMSLKVSGPTVLFKMARFL